MGVVTFSGDAFHGAPYGGTARYVLELRSGLIARGQSARIVTGLHSHGQLHDLGIGHFVGPPLPPLAVKVATRLAGSLAESRAIRTAAATDIYHKTWFGPVPGALQACKATLAVTVYDMIHEIFPDDFDAMDRTAARKREWCSAADVVFAISETTRRDLISHFGVAPSKVHVTPLGVRPLLNEGADYGGPSRPFILYVGSRFRRYKGFDVLLAAMRTIDPRIALMCFGGGPFAADEQRAIDRAALGARVMQASGTDSTLGHLYRQALALVYPSRYEGFGLPPLEAMSVGCPVIAAAAPAVVEVVGSAAITVATGDVDALADAIESLINSPERRADLAIRGRAHATAYTWDRTVDTTVRGYLYAMEQRQAIR